jgi:UDP-3-O-[3-hydroxymyristoyl] N-acetylglucosamine deacetylase
MPSRFQQTLARPATVTGIGFLSGADITVRFFPAPAGSGITFTRVDLADPFPIPARLEFTALRSRRTALEHRGVAVELIEHAMAALAGLQIDNCRVELNGPELPGCDGSSLVFVDALLDAGILILNSPRAVCHIGIPAKLEFLDDGQSMQVQPTRYAGLRITYQLDYGPDSPIPFQEYTVDVSPETFVREIAFARTFVLEEEARMLQAQGIGQRLSFRDLLIYGKQGVIGNELRAPDECVRHKILDCIGDLALLGCDLSGHVLCRRTGHRQNAEMVRAIQEQRCADARGVRYAA